MPKRKRSEWTQNNTNNSEAEYLRNEDKNPENISDISVSIELETYNQKIGWSNDLLMGLSLCLSQENLKVFRYSTDVNKLYNMMLTSNDIFVRVFMKNNDLGNMDKMNSQNSLGLGLCLMDSLYRLQKAKELELPEGDAPPVTHILQTDVKLEFINFLRECSLGMKSRDKDKISEMIVFIRQLRNMEESMDKDKWPNDDFIRYLLDDVPRILVTKDSVNTSFDAFVSLNGISKTAKLPISECFSLLKPTLSVLKLDVEGSHFFPTFSVQEWQDESCFTITDRIKQCLSALAFDICSMNQKKISHDKRVYMRHLEKQTVVADTFEDSEGFDFFTDNLDGNTPSETERIADTFEGTYISFFYLLP